MKTKHSDEAADKKLIAAAFKQHGIGKKAKMGKGKAKLGKY